MNLQLLEATADSSAQASDARMVDEALADLDYSDRVPSLTEANAKLGRFSIAKARIHLYSALTKTY